MGNSNETRAQVEWGLRYLRERYGNQEDRMERKTQILTVHWTRYVAQRRERAIQDHLDRAQETTSAYGLPDWAVGARVRKAGRFQWVVEATSWKGH